MRLTLLESERSFFQIAESTFASTVLHAGIVLLTLGATADGPLLPADEREARAFFLLPPDRMDVQSRQSEIFQLGRAGGYFTGGLELAGSGDDERIGGRPYGRPRAGQRSSVQGTAPFGPPALLSDSVFSLLEVDEMVERYEGSAAPIYPEDLAARGTEGRVQDHLRGGRDRPGGHYHHPGAGKRQPSLHRIGSHSARRNAVPTGQEGRKDRATVGRAAIQLPDCAASSDEQADQLSLRSCLLTWSLLGVWRLSSSRRRIPGIRPGSARHGGQRRSGIFPAAVSITAVARSDRSSPDY